MSDPFNTVLHKLDEWRHLPKYRLEQHVDVLFGLTLPAVLAAHAEVAKDDLHVIPEFPVRYGLMPSDLKGHAKDNQSFNVDFAVLSRSSGQMFLVELKTDDDSLKPEQLTKMCYIRNNIHATQLVDGIACIAGKSKKRKKYAQLIWLLHEAGAMNVPPEFRELDMACNPPKSVFHKCISAGGLAKHPKLYLVTPNDPKVKVPCCFNKIGFREYADAIDGSCSLASTLACYLRRWRGEAGRTNPWQRSSPST